MQKISFNELGIEAIRDGRKTMTRRKDLTLPPKYESGQILVVNGTDLKLKIKSVKIETLNKISHEDALKEGIIPIKCSLLEFLGLYPNFLQSGYGFKDKIYDLKGKETQGSICSFFTLWESIYGNGSFNDDLVYVIEFEKMEE